MAVSKKNVKPPTPPCTEPLERYVSSVLVATRFTGMEIYVYVHNILKGDLPTRASGRERSGQSSVHFGETRSIAGLIGPYTHPIRAKCVVCLGPKLVTASCAL
jgi:hypothetical protein